VFAACMQAVMKCTDPDGRRRCDMFVELPSRKASAFTINASSSHSSNSRLLRRQEYPDYFHTITSPIAISTIRKRSSGPHYKSVAQYLNDWRLMFNNAKTYNQEGSWVYVDAEEMQKVLEATFRQQTVGSGLPGAEPGAGSVPSGLGSLAAYQAASSPLEDDDIPRAPKSSKGSRIGKQVQSDESYYSGGSDDE